MSQLKDEYKCASSSMDRALVFGTRFVGGSSPFWRTVEQYKPNLVKDKKNWYNILL